MNTKMRGQRIGEVPEIEGSLPCLLFGKGTCPGCVSPETVISGAFKPIRESILGEPCLSKSGASQIIKTYTHEYSGELYEVRAVGLLPLRFTPEHPVLVVSGKHVHTHRWTPELKTHGLTHELKLDRPHWKDASQLQSKTNGKHGDYLLVPRLTGTFSARNVTLGTFTTPRGMSVARARRLPVSMDLTDSTSWLLGMYVAEGYSNKKGVVAFCLGKHESGLAATLSQRISELGYHPSVRQTRTATEVHISSRILARAMPVWCGKGARFKHVPPFIFSNRRNSIVRAFLEGYLEGDGYEYRNLRSRSLTRGAATTSCRLALELQLLLVRLGITALVGRVERSGSTRIEDRTVNWHDYYRVTWCHNPKTRHAAILEDYVAYPIRSVKTMEYNGTVHNLETSDGTFLAGNAIVHNCYSEAVHRIRKAKVVPGAARANGKGLLRAGVWREWTPEDWERFKKLFPERRYFLVTRGIWPEEFYGRVLADPLLVNLQVSAWHVDGELSPDVEKLKRLLSASDKTIVRVITSGENAAAFSRLIEELGCWWRFMETPWRKPGGPKTYGTETPLDALGTRVGIRCNTPCETCVKENGFLGCAATAPFLKLLPTFPEFQPARHERRERKRMLWKRLVLMALNNLGGEAELKDLYAEVLAIEPAVSESPLWKTRVRAKVQELCVRTGKGRWNLVPKETAPSEEVLVRVKGGGAEACPS